MSVFSKESLDKLIALLTSKLDSLNEFYALAVEQRKCIEEENTEQLNKHMDSRQKIIDTINRLHQEIDVLMQSYTSAVDGLPGSTRSKVTALESSIQDKLRSIAEIDAINKKAMELSKDKFLQEAKKTTLSRKSIGAYNQVDYISSSDYFDAKQ